MLTGLIFGLILVAGLANGMIGMPLTLGFLIITSRTLHWSGEAKILATLIALKGGWITGLLLLRGAPAPFSVVLLLSFDCALLITMLLRRPAVFTAGLSVPVLLLFVGDFSFNAWTMAFGSDPLGREAFYRPGDVLPRLGGLFSHPFYSINISVVAMLFSLMYWRSLLCKVIFLAAFLNIASNGSMRGAVLLVVFFGVMFLLKRRVPFPALLIACILAAAGVFGITAFSTNYLPPGSGNHYRVFAWKNALSVVQAHPVTGYGSFQTGEIYAINEDTFQDYGIAESFYLDLAIRYGVFPAIMHFAILVFVFYISVRRLYIKGADESRLRFIRSLFAGVAFVDSFYGTFLGSVLTSICFGVLQFTCRAQPETAITKIPIQSG